MQTKTPNINQILSRPEYNASSRYGAQMGRRNQTQGAPELLHVQRVKFIDGDYDAGGAYWGGGGIPLYCGFSGPETTNDEPIMVFVRARSAEEAKVLIADELPEEGFTFLG